MNKSKLEKARQKIAEEFAGKLARTLVKLPLSMQARFWQEWKKNNPKED